ncbi:hypothetical protein J7J18_04640 [bacterium]|nr:hypothetical protein [bacterium]
MVELVLTWGYVEENLEIILEKVKSGDQKTIDAMSRLCEINPERFVDLMDAWERNSFEEYRKKWKS